MASVNQSTKDNGKCSNGDNQDIFLCKQEDMDLVDHYVLSAVGCFIGFQ